MDACKEGNKKLDNNFNASRFLIKLEHVLKKGVMMMSKKATRPVFIKNLNAFLVF